MFDVILEKYKKNMRSSIPIETCFQMGIMIIGIFIIAINCFLEFALLYAVGGGLILVPLGWILIREKVNEKREAKKSLDELFGKRNTTFEKFLVENKICDLDNRNWLREKCCEKLKEHTRPTEYLMPFFTIVIIPIILIFVKLIVDKVPLEESVGYIILIIVLTLFLYLSGRALESNIIQMSDKKIYYVKRLRDDLDTYEFFLRKDEVKNAIVKE